LLPAILIPHGTTIEISLSNAYLAGGLAAAGVGWSSKNLLLTIVLGMAAFWGWTWILSFYP